MKLAQFSRGWMGSISAMCNFISLSSSEAAAWVQAIVSSLAIVVSAYVVVWQVRRGRFEQSEREARVLDGLAHLIAHLKQAAYDARSERRNLRRLPLGHPAEPSALFLDISETLRRFPLDTVPGAIPIEALLKSRRTATEMEPLVSPEPELDRSPENDRTFEAYVASLDQQILLLRKESEHLKRGNRGQYSADHKSGMRST